MPVTGGDDLLMKPDEIARLSNEEKNRRLTKLIALEPYVDILVEDAEYKKARGTLVKYWHKIVIAGAALAVAIGTLWTQWQTFINASVR